MIAEVIINTIAKELNRTYDYIIPDSILEDVKIGSRVFVPFGRKKLEEGYVIGIKDKSSFANKEIIKVEDSILTEGNIELAKIMAKRYFCNISDCIRLMLPPGTASKNIVTIFTSSFKSLIKFSVPLTSISFTMIFPSFIFSFKIFLDVP